jgi:hypothetical protein
MKLFQISALALCLSIPMAHANDDASSCLGRFALLTTFAAATGAAATQVYNDFHRLSREDRIARPSLVIVMATCTAIAAEALNVCITSNCTSNK